jgi:hypothetical protein
MKPKILFILLSIISSSIAEQHLIDSLYNHSMTHFDSLFEQDTTIDKLDQNTNLSNINKQKNKFGILFGICGSNFYGSGADKMNSDILSHNLNPGNRYGILIGASVNYAFNDIFNIGIDCYYDMKGKKATGSFDEVYYTQIYKFDYIEIPLLFRLNIPTSSVFKPNISFGPLISFLASAKSYYKLEYNGKVHDTSIAIDGSIKSSEYGIVLGIGGYENTDVGIVSLDARLSLGLSTIDNSSSNAIIKNWQIALILGFYVAYND